MAQSDFVEHLLDQMAAWGGVSARRMFGGWGVYRAGVMFGLVADDVFYLKADDGNRPSLESAGMRPFSYRRAGKPAIVMSYWECPPDALDSAEELIALARGAHAAALRSGAKAKKPLKPAPKKAAKKAVKQAAKPAVRARAAKRRRGGA